MQIDSNSDCPAGETSRDNAGRERELETAEAELAVARGELKAAETDIEKAAHTIEALIEEEKHPHQFKVTVIYNGVPKPFEVRRDELVKRLLDEAKQAFGPINNAHLLGLFNKAGVELKDDQTIEAAGVKPDEVLLLRPSSVRGG
jgi:hypothetical protein